MAIFVHLETGMICVVEGGQCADLLDGERRPLPQYAHLRGARVRGAVPSVADGGIESEEGLVPLDAIPSLLPAPYRLVLDPTSTVEQPAHHLAPIARLEEGAFGNPVAVA